MNNQHLYECITINSFEKKVSYNKIFEGRLAEHKIITRLSVFPLEREKYSTKVLKSVIECLTSSNIIIYTQRSDWIFTLIRD